MPGFNQRGTGLILFALAILVITGAIYNNFTTGRAFAVVAPSGNCNFASPQINCAQFPTNANNLCLGNNCQLYAPTFLNPNSVFTSLLSGDVGAVLNVFTSSQGNNPSSLVGAVSACSYIQGTGSASTANSFSCKSIAWLRNFGSPPFPVIVGGTSCACFNVTTNQPLDIPANLNGINLASLSVRTIITGSNTCNDGNGSGTWDFATWQVTGELANTTSGNALSNGGPASVQFFGDFCSTDTSPTVRIYQFVETTTNLQNGFEFIGWIAAAVMLVLSLGITFGFSVLGTGTNLGSNPQGTRLMQVFGFGFFIFIPLFSEFGTWISPTVLGWGLDVIILFAVFGTFFFGLYDQTTSGGGGV